MNKPSASGFSVLRLDTHPRGRSWREQFSTALAILLALTPMILTAGLSLSKPLIMDEMEFPAVAQAIAATGKPEYYRGETAPNNQGLWHPPLYILTLALWQRLFGSSIEINRAFGLFNALLAICLTGGFVLRRWHSSAASEGVRRLWPVVLIVGLLSATTSPLLIQGSILPDIDTQVLPLTLTAMMLALFELRRSGVSEKVYWLVFVCLMALQLFAKLTTPVLIVPAFMLFEFVRGLDQQVGVRRAIYRAAYVALAAAGGLLLLLALWYVMAAIWGVSFELPFIYLTQSSNNPINFSGGGNVLATMLANVPEHAGYIIQWIGIPALVFVALLIVRELSSPQQGLLYGWERAAIYTFILLLMLMYIVLKPAPFVFPKYYPPLIIPLALLVCDFLFALSHKRAGLFLAFLGALVVLYVAYAELRPSAGGRDFIGVYYLAWPKTPVLLVWMLQPLLAAMLAGIIIARMISQRLIDGVLVGVIAIMLGWQINVAFKQAQAPYSTTYYYGENSLSAVTSYLRGVLPDGAIVVAPKDLGWRLQDRWRYVELTFDPRQDLARPGVEYLIMRKNDAYGYYILHTPEIEETIAQEYMQVAEIENFVVLRKR